MVSQRGSVADVFGSVFAGRVRRAGLQEAVAPGPGVVFMAGGHPDTSIFGEGTLHEMASAVVGDGAAALQYGLTDGTEAMRETAAGLMTSEGTPARAVNISVTNGAQQALDLAGRAFLDHGDLALIESPTYHGALQAFSSYGPRVMTAPVDRRGLDVGAVREILAHERRAGYRAKFIYIVPTFQNPTGATMKLERRLLSEARRLRLKTSQLERLVDGGVAVDPAAREAATAARAAAGDGL